MSSKENFPLNEVGCTTQGNTKRVDGRGVTIEGEVLDPREEPNPRDVNERKNFPCLEKKLQKRTQVNVKRNTKMGAINTPCFGLNDGAPKVPSLDRFPFERGGTAAW